MSMPNIPPWLNIILQLVIALLIIFILYLVTLYILNIDSLVKQTSLVVKQNEKIKVVDGFATPSFLYGLSFNTVNPYTENYRKISRSLNSKGGASFTYQFWIKIEDTNDANYKDLVLLHKGDTTKYNLAYYAKSQTSSDPTKYDLKLAMPPDAYVACPSIAFGDSYRQLKVRFNTNNDVYNQISIDMNADAEPSSRKNLLSLMPINWTLLTFTFEDNYSIIENAENGIKFTFYINDVPYWTESASTTPIFRNDFLKQNDGNLSILPNLTATGNFMKLGNIMYYNYTVSDADIKETFSRGPPKYAAVAAKDIKTVPPSYISALNKIDVYNY